MIEVKETVRFISQIHVLKLHRKYEVLKRTSKQTGSVIDMMIQYEGKILLLFSELVVSGAVPLTSNPIWTIDVVLYRE